MYRRVLGSLTPVAALAGLLALTGCGDDDAAATLPSYSIAPESYVTRPPATTTTTIPLDELEPGEKATQEQQYEVQSGDYLAAIAERYQVSIDEIAEYNDWTDGANHALYPGDIVEIPPNAIVPDGASGETPSTPLAGEDFVDTTDAGGEDSSDVTLGDNCAAGSYELESGDYPIGVAEKFDVTLDALNEANASTSGYSAFYPGLKIVIPAKANCD